MYTLAMATTAMRMVADTRFVLAKVDANGSTAPPLMARHMTAMTMSAICATHFVSDQNTRTCPDNSAIIGHRPSREKQTSDAGKTRITFLFA